MRNHARRVWSTGRIRGVAISIALIAALSAAYAHAQSRGATQTTPPPPKVHPISGRVFAGVMGYQGAEWLDREERDIEEEPDRALDALGIKKGDVVADVGAGSGYLTVRLAKRVGSEGRVYGEDIQPEMITLLT